MLFIFESFFKATCLVLCLSATSSTVLGQVWLGWGPMNVQENAQQSLQWKPLEPTYPTRRVTWPRPEKVPAWYTQAQEKLQALARIRQALTQPIDIELEGKSLKMVFLYLTEKTDVPFFLNVPELDLLGVDPDTPITMKATTTLGEFISLMLEPLELTYRVRLAGIEITSRDAVESEPTVECYDLRLAISSSELIKPLVETVMETVDPDSWIRAGGTSTCMLVGHVLVISAPESTHDKIRSLLANLAQFRSVDESPAKAAKVVKTDE